MLRVKLVANAGLLLEYQGTTMLVDGIFGSEAHAFSNFSPEVWQQMLRGEPPFQKIDYLLFTHAHTDHFSPEMTLTYLKQRPVKGLFLPDTPEISESGLTAWLQEKKIPCALLSQRTDRAVFRPEPGILVRALCTRHRDKKFEHVQHLCYLLTFGEKNVLITADLDYTTETLQQIEDIPLHAAFINPLFFSVLRRKRFFKGELHAEHLCIYHVPFAEDDHLNMRPILQRDLEQWESTRGRVIALTEPLQEILL